MASSLGALDPELWSFMKSIVVPASRSPGFALAKLYRDELRSVRARVFAYVNIPREALSAFDTYARLCTPDQLVMTMTQCGWQGPGKPPAPVALFQMLVAHDMLLLPPKKKDADRIRAYLTNAVDADRLAPMEDFWLDPYELSHRYHYDDAMKADGGDEDAMARMAGAIEQRNKDNERAWRRHANYVSTDPAPGVMPLPSIIHEKSISASPFVCVIYRRRTESRTGLPKYFIHELRAIDELYRETVVGFHFARFMRHVFLAGGAEGDFKRARFVSVLKVNTAWKVDTFAGGSDDEIDS